MGSASRFREELLKIKLPWQMRWRICGDCHVLRDSDQLKGLIKEMKLDKAKLCNVCPTTAGLDLR
jgi:hypothetical protein